ncbi:MAG: substrate-binding domain-containing protein [Anaerolineales bacterium]|nr:substrate-binding domain-containing protein [Anaerolineales bacterium]
MSTLREIADRLGVSTATVSRVLNDKPGVSQKTRERVLTLAQELQYRPNLAARSLATSSTKTVLFLVHRRQFSAAEDPFYPFIMHGLEEALKDDGYNVMLVTLDDAQLAAGPANLRVLQEQRADALVMAGPDISPKFILAASILGLTTLLVDNALRESPFTSVQPQNEEGAHTSTAHLIETHNHTRIVLMRGPQGWASSDERTAGYLSAIHAAGLEPFIVEMEDTTTETGEEAAKQTFKEFPETTGIVAVNDAMAIGAMRALGRMGRRIPKDVAVVGFDDISWASYANPPLTTVAIPTVEMGRLAGRLLLEQMNGSISATTRVRVATQLAIRQSCGCDDELAPAE